MIPNTTGSGSYIMGFGNNVSWNGTSFTTLTDTASNGASLMGMNYGSGAFTFYVVPTNTPSSGQTISPLSMSSYLRATIDSNGINGTLGATTPFNATVNNLTVNGNCTGCGVGKCEPGGAAGDRERDTKCRTSTTLQADDLSSKNFPVIDVRAWGAIGDGKFIPDNCSMTAGSNVVTCSGTSASAPFVATAPPFSASDVGKTFWMPGAGNAGRTTIWSQQFQLCKCLAGEVVSQCIEYGARSSATYGHDNYAALCAVSNCTSATVPNNWYAWPRNGKQIHVPAGMYLTSHPLYVRNGDMWWGDGETASNLRLMSATNDLFVMCVDGNASAGTDTCTGDQFSAGASQTFTVKGFFLSNGTMNADMTHGPTGIYVPPEASAYKLVDNWFDTSRRESSSTRETAESSKTRFATSPSFYIALRWTAE